MSLIEDALAGNVPVPTYDRTALTTGIVHFGLGNFHRAHQAMFIDRLMSEGKALDWAICGVGVMPADQKMREALRAQNGLFTLVLKHPNGTREPRVIGSIREYLYAPDDPEAVLAKLADPSIRIVELTITEGGFNIHRVTGDFDLTNPAIIADLQDDAVPATVFGLVVEGLRRRRNAGVAPFTVMSCDNIQGNGHVASQTFGAFAEAKDSALATWIRDNVNFPNSMVDRINPATTDADRSLVQDMLGIYDRWPVMAEPFVQWVLEDTFTFGRPPHEDVGVQVVDDVMPYELMNLRLLNASHQALTYFGYLSGHRYAHEAATDPLIVSLLTRYMDEEATPTLSPVPGIDLDAYKAELLVRFANPEIRDTLARLCQDSSDRIPKWLLPVVRWNLDHDGPINLAAAVVASWARYAEGVDEQGLPITVVDNLAEELVPLAQTYPSNHLSFLENEHVFGDLAAHTWFADSYVTMLEALHARGAQVALRDFLE